MENREKETFSFKYSAKEQEEIKAIRKKYEAPEQTEDKMEQLRRLDAAVTQKATTVSLVLGIIGALILGSGMSLAMTEIGRTLGLQSGTDMLIGIIIGIAGIVLVCAAYPVYGRIVKKERAKIAP
ncbi:MAG: hypothetical protein IJO96_06300, partial [Oscillospiraceae bacterium]|nr:hypothetical protein [Oscillospiraceae bacterium]